MRRRSILGNGFVDDVLDLLEDHADDEIALLVGVAGSGRHIELEPPKQVVRSQGKDALEL